MSTGKSPKQSPPEDFEPATYLRQLTQRPGVYRMFNAKGDILYVGKARNLKRRVSSYFSRKAADAKTMAMVAQVARIEVTVTQTEDEALLLESNLIKTHQPRYNIVFRDDKSYPYLFLSGNHAFPRLAFHRGAQRLPGRYFGPYPNAGAVRDMQDTLYKLFKVRQCDDSFFANRSRPCLQYQIKRCSAPCVGLIAKDEYLRDTEDATSLLEGKTDVVVDRLVNRMELAASELEYEQAARYREQVATIRRMQEQPLQAGKTTDCDVVVGDIREGQACVVIVSIRNRMNFGHRSFFPKAPNTASAEDVVSAFISQHYLQQVPPREILLTAALPEQALLEQALTIKCDRKVRIVTRPRGPRQALLNIAQATLQQAISGRLSNQSSAKDRLSALQDVLQLSTPPHQIECFDISHTQGERMVASCVVFVDGQADKASYRRFNIEGVAPGDDYAALRQAIERRFARLKTGEGRMPDLLIIDGGAGQLQQGLIALQELAIEQLRLLAVAKGPSRKAGLEQIFLPGQKTPLVLPPDSPALHMIQQVRDEAHRFAIAGHRRQRDKARTRSVLDDIEGLGPVKKQRVLKAFGGVRQLSRASVSELMRVEGISATLAQKVYDYFHEGH